MVFKASTIKKSFFPDQRTFSPIRISSTDDISDSDRLDDITENSLEPKSVIAGPFHARDQMTIEHYIGQLSKLRTDKNRNRYPAVTNHRTPQGRLRLPIPLADAWQPLNSNVMILSIQKG